MKTATGNSLLRAYNRCARNAKDPKISSNTTSAGFVIPAGQKRGQREGWQVFVKMVRYSDARLKKSPMTGGLAVRP